MIIASPWMSSDRRVKLTLTVAQKRANTFHKEMKLPTITLFWEIEHDKEAIFGRIKFFSMVQFVQYLAA